MKLLSAILALLPLYPQDSSGAWNYNMRFPTELFWENEEGFCVLHSPVELSPNGVEYRAGFAFGYRNEISLSFARLGPRLVGPISLVLDDGSEYTFSQHNVDQFEGVTVHRWTMSRSMMGRLLSSLRDAEFAAIQMPLETSMNMTFPIIISDRETAFEGARRCEDYRLGRVLTD